MTIRFANARRLLQSWPIADLGVLRRVSAGDVRRDDDGEGPALGFVVGILGFYLSVSR